jgi:hypothetical protein
MQTLAQSADLNGKVSDTGRLVYCKAVAALGSRRLGEGLVEYGLMLAIIALIVMAVVKWVAQV